LSGRSEQRRRWSPDRCGIRHAGRAFPDVCCSSPWLKPPLIANGGDYALKHRALATSLLLRRADPTVRTAVPTDFEFDPRAKQTTPLTAALRVLFNCRQPKGLCARPPVIVWSGFFLGDCSSYWRGAGAGVAGGSAGVRP